MKISAMQAIGYIGGSFDPVHLGHLRVALEFAEAFALDKAYLMPCYQSPHRQLPQANAAQRLAMLELAVAQCAHLAVDARELQTTQLSYTVDTLRAIRQEIGDEVALYFAMGADAFNAIERWKDWQQLFALANIVVLHRPNYSLHVHSDFIAQRRREFTGEHHCAGGFYELAVTSLNISSTQIRAHAHNQQSVQFLVPQTVAHYIQQHRLYQS